MSSPKVGRIETRLCRLADTWTAGISAYEYAAFLKQLLKKVVREVPIYADMGQRNMFMGVSHVWKDEADCFFDEETFGEAAEELSEPQRERGKRTLASSHRKSTKNLDVALQRRAHSKSGKHVGGARQEASHQVGVGQQSDQESPRHESLKQPEDGSQDSPRHESLKQPVGNSRESPHRKSAKQLVRASQESRSSAAKIQSHFRARQARQQSFKRQAAVVKVQSHGRGLLARKKAMLRRALGAEAPPGTPHAPHALMQGPDRRLDRGRSMRLVVPPSDPVPTLRLASRYAAKRSQSLPQLVPRKSSRSPPPATEHWLPSGVGKSHFGHRKEAPFLAAVSQVEMRRSRDNGAWRKAGDAAAPAGFGKRVPAFEVGRSPSLPGRLLGAPRATRARIDWRP